MMDRWIDRQIGVDTLAQSKSYNTVAQRNINIILKKETKSKTETMHIYTFETDI